MQPPVLYQKKLIPELIIELKNDTIIYQDDELIITKWRTIHPHPHLTHGVSCYFLQDGIKVGRFYDHERFKFWYCDIIRTEYDAKANQYTFVDLLLDVIIKPDGFVKVVDLDELCDAAEQKLITQEELAYVLRTADTLLRCIYSGKFYSKIAPLEAADEWKPSDEQS